MATTVAWTLHRILLQLGATISAAESLSVGEVQTHLGSCPGSSGYFRGGMTVYTLDMKVKHLGVDKAHAESVNCVSPQVAREMARGIRQEFETEIGISTTGYAEPDPDNGVEKPYAWVGYDLFDHRWEERVDPEGVNSISMSSDEDRRTEAQEDVGYMAIQHLVDWFREVHAGERKITPDLQALLVDRGFFEKPWTYYEPEIDEGEEYGYH